VRGLSGAVRSATLFKLDSVSGAGVPSWVQMTSTVLAAAGGSELEVSVDVTGLGQATSALIVLIGWEGATDLASTLPLGPLSQETRMSPRGGWDELPIPEFGTVAAPALATIVGLAIARRARRSRATRAPLA
jgi:hypothetical protein